MNGTRPIISSLHGMIAAAHPLAAFAGAGVLRNGGNAFDAAVATAAALNVVEPFMSGLAGLGMASCFIAKEGRVRCLDFVPGVPRNFDLSNCTKDDIYLGAKASGVPGNLAGWYRMASDFGTMNFAQLLEPAINLARDGFPVTAGLQMLTKEYWNLRSINAEWVRVYTPGNNHIVDGWILKQPDLARSLERIATYGPSELYGGKLGEQIVQHLERAGGALAMADLEAVNPQWSDPITISYRGLDVHTLAPPSEAFQFLLTLAILKDTPLRRYTPNGVEHLDSVFRAVRIAAEERIRMNHQPPDAIADILHGDRLTQLRNEFVGGGGLHGRVQQWRAITDPALVGRREHTTSFSTADRDGNMVCVTQSLGSVYGSGVVVPNTGVCMNNFLNWTDLDPASPNRLRPGDRLGMCLAPTISTRKSNAVLALGTPGSYGILHTQVQAMVQYLDFELPLDEAINAPRARLWDGNLVHIESRIEGDVIQALRKLGHQIVAVEPFTRIAGGMHAIERRTASGALTGAADLRRDGYAAAP